MLREAVECRRAEEGMEEEVGEFCGSIRAQSPSRQMWKETDDELTLRKGIEHIRAEPLECPPQPLGPDDSNEHREYLPPLQTFQHVPEHVSSSISVLGGRDRGKRQRQVVERRGRKGLEAGFDGIEWVDEAAKSVWVLGPEQRADALEKTAPRAPARAEPKGVRGGWAMMSWRGGRWNGCMVSARPAIIEYRP